MDDIDKKILTKLQGNARLSNSDLAAQINLSPSPCWRRLKRLEESGIIKKYVALLDPKMAGLKLMAYAHVSLENHHAETVAHFDETIRTCPEVLECVSTSGEYDYLLKVMVSDMMAYETFLTHRLLQMPGIRNVNTSFVLRQKKFTTALALGTS